MLIITRIILSLVLLPDTPTACLRNIVCWMPQGGSPNSLVVVSEIAYDGEIMCGTTLQSADGVFRAGGAIALNIVTLTTPAGKNQPQTALRYKEGWQGNVGILKKTASGQTEQGGEYAHPQKDCEEC